MVLGSVILVRSVGDDRDWLVGTVVFDWDGVSGRGRNENASQVCDRVIRLCELGADVVIVTGTDVADVDGQLRARPAGPGRLFIVANRGSEVFRVDAEGPSRVRRSTATAEDEAALSAAPERSRDDPGEPPVGKRDAVEWVTEQLLDEGGPETVLVVGHEPERAGGVEEALDDALDTLSSFPAPTADPSWRIEVEGFDPLREREFESWFTVANGRTGTRGSLEEESDESEPATYLAGLFAYADSAPMGPQMAVGPEWTRMAPRAGRESLALVRGEQLEHRRILDLRQGMLFRIWKQRLPGGAEVTFRSARFASLAERRMLVIEANAGSPDVVVDPDVVVRLDGRRPLPPGPGPFDELDVRRHRGRTVVAVRARRGSYAAFASSTAGGDGGSLRRLFTVAGPSPREAPVREAEKLLTRAEALGVTRIRAHHRTAWRARWRDADVIIEGDVESQRAMRFALYHLISAADPETDAVSIGARGLTGSGYLGHVFWDTDVFMAPFFIWTHPQTARALLAYRYRTLPGARSKAAGLGFRGALYAWESADTGEEVTPTEAQTPDGMTMPILTGRQEHHISADVAWAVWLYWRVTADDGFMAEMGAEIILETARFWASRARRGPDGRHHIARVIGPDEYHEGVRDNAFTNVMARWNIERGLEVAELLLDRDKREWGDIIGRLDLRTRELRRWRTVAEGLADGFDPDTRLFEEFAGYFGLEDLRAVDLAPRPFPADLLLGRPRLHRTQLVKQPDVVMLAHMLPDLVAPDVAAANYRYYEPRTSHGSSLSPAVHAAVAARIGEADDAMSYFRMAAGIDLDDRMGNASAGIHMATMGGLWQAAVTGFGGLRAEEAGVRIDPRLPPAWDRLAFPVRWRGTPIRVDVTRDRLLLVLGGAVEVAVGSGAFRRLGPGRYVSRRHGRRWRRPEKEE